MFYLQVQLLKPTNEVNMLKVLGYVIKTVLLIKFSSSYFQLFKSLCQLFINVKCCYSAVKYNRSS